jgi:hypothetical protein
VPHSGYHSARFEAMLNFARCFAVLQFIPRWTEIGMRGNCPVTLLHTPIVVFNYSPTTYVELVCSNFPSGIVANST